MRLPPWGDFPIASERLGFVLSGFQSVQSSLILTPMGFQPLKASLAFIHTHQLDESSSTGKGDIAMRDCN